MHRLIPIFLVLLLALPAWAQSSSGDDTAQMRQEIEQLKNTIKALETRIAAQELRTPPAAQPADTQTATVKDLTEKVQDLNERVGENERRGLKDRLSWTGDYRFEGHTIRANVPTYYDGMKIQNLMVRTFWMTAPTSQGGLGVGFNPAMLSMPPAAFAATVNGAVTANYGQYQYYTNNLTFSALKANFNGMMGMLTPAQQQQFMGLLMNVPGVLTQGYKADVPILYTNRLRLKFDAKVADNISFTARVSMYKAWGDSTGVQVFNGLPTSMAMDGMTTSVPNSDILRVERAYFSWNKIGGSKFYLSIGRRPSTDGPPMNFRNDEPRGGTPGGTIINWQFDGLAFGYNVSEKTILRFCYGVGYSSGFGNGANLHPSNQVKDVHFMGANLDLYSTEKTFVNVTIARAFRVSDGFAGEVVLPVNPLTGDSVPSAIMRYQPSANLGDINLYGIVLQRTLSSFEFYGSANWDSLRPNGNTTPFGGLGSDPFETPVNHDGFMVLGGVRFNVPQNDGRTKIGFEFNHGSKYWFNFAQAEDDIFMPKTQTRGEVYETYLTHRINDHFIFKGGYQRFNYTYSGSGWWMMTPKKLTDSPILGFPSYKDANMLSFGLTARF